MSLLPIIEKLAQLLQGNDNIHALWLEGSYATGKQTDKSDIDVWMDVDDGTFDRCIDDFRNKLRTIAEIRSESSRGVYSHSPKLTKQTFYLKGYPDEQCIELDLQEHSREFKFKKGHHQIKVLFDKDSTIRWSD